MTTKCPVSKAYSPQAQRQEEQAEKERRAKGKASNQGLALQLHYKRLMQDEAKVCTDSAFPLSRFFFSLLVKWLKMAQNQIVMWVLLDFRSQLAPKVAVLKQTLKHLHALIAVANLLVFWQ